MTTLTTNENRTPLRIVAAIIAISFVASLFLCWLVYYHAPADVTGTRLACGHLKSCRLSRAVNRQSSTAD